MLKNINVDDRAFVKIEALINSMTKQEREKPEIIGKSRKERITKGSGVDVKELNKLLKQFKELKKMMKQVSNMKGQAKRTRGFRMPKFPF